MNNLDQDEFKVSNELAFLLAATSDQLQHQVVNVLETLIIDGIEWQRFAQLVAFHGQMPLLAYLLKQPVYSEIAIHVPRWIHEKCDNYARRNLANTMRLEAELRRIESILANQKVLAIPYKGIALAERIYSDSSLRQAGDIDIIVRPEDFLTAKRALTGQGYRTAYQFQSDSQARQYEKDVNDFALYHDKSRLTVELHRDVLRPFDPFQLDWPGIWQRSIAEKNSPWRYLAPEDLLLILCFHGSKHQWVSLKWMVDIAIILEKIGPQIAWSMLLQRSKKAKLHRTLLVSLAACNQLLGSPLPTVVETQIAKTQVTRAVTQEIIKALENPQKYATNSLKLIRFNMRLIENPFDRLSLGIRLVGSINFQDIEDGETFLSNYYRRIVRLCGKYGKQGIERIGM